MNDVSILTDCRSAEEFLLKLSVFGSDYKFSFSDLSDMLSCLSEKSYFIRPLADIISETDIFDAVLLSEAVSLDYNIAKSFHASVDRCGYCRFSALRMLEANQPSWEWQFGRRPLNEESKKAYSEDFKYLMHVIVRKIEAAVGKNVPSVVNFKMQMGL